MDAPPWAKMREHMVRSQLESRGIRDARVLAAFRRLGRHAFVPEEFRLDAYEDRPVAIGWEQTLTQPYLTAFVAEMLRVREGDKVLEVGTGTGFQAAVFEALGAEVFTIEIVPELAREAELCLKEAGCRKVRVRSSDGAKGWPEFAPYDAVFVACAARRMPPELGAQLKEGGRMVVPVGPESGIQELLLFEKKHGKFASKDLAPVRFVPMTGEERHPQHQTGLS